MPQPVPEPTPSLSALYEEFRALDRTLDEFIRIRDPEHSDDAEFVTTRQRCSDIIDAIAVTPPVCLPDCVAKLRAFMTPFWIDNSPDEWLPLVQVIAYIEDLIFGPWRR